MRIRREYGCIRDDAGKRGRETQGGKGSVLPSEARDWQRGWDGSSLSANLAPQKDEDGWEPGRRKPVYYDGVNVRAYPVHGVRGANGGMHGGVHGVASVHGHGAHMSLATLRLVLRCYSHELGDIAVPVLGACVAIAEGLTQCRALLRDGLALLCGGFAAAHRADQLPAGKKHKCKIRKWQKGFVGSRSGRFADLSLLDMVSP